MDPFRGRGSKKKHRRAFWMKCERKFVSVVYRFVNGETDESEAVKRLLKMPDLVQMQLMEICEWAGNQSNSTACVTEMLLRFLRTMRDMWPFGKQQSSRNVSMNVSKMKHFFIKHHGPQNKEKPEDWCNVTNQTENPKILEPPDIKNGRDNCLQDRLSLPAEDQGNTKVNNDSGLVQGYTEDADDINDMQIGYFDMGMNIVFNMYMCTYIFYHMIGRGRQDFIYPIQDKNNSSPVEDPVSQSNPSVGQGCHEQDAKDNVQMHEGYDFSNTTASHSDAFQEKDTITDDSQLYISNLSERVLYADFLDNNAKTSQNSNPSPQDRNSSFKAPDSTVRLPMDNPEDQNTTLTVGVYSHGHSAKDNAKMHGGNDSVDNPLSQKKDVGPTTCDAQLQIKSTANTVRGNIKAHDFTSGSESRSRSRLAHEISKSTSSIDTQVSLLNEGHMYAQVRNTRKTSLSAISSNENASTVLEHTKLIVSNHNDRYVIFYKLLILDEEVKQLIQVVEKKSPIIDHDKNPKVKEELNHKKKETSFFIAILEKGDFSFELHSKHVYSQILDADELDDFILGDKRSILLSVVAFQSVQYSNMKFSVLGHIKQSVASQMLLDIFLSAKHDYNEQDVNSTVANFYVLRARRKTVLHSRYWLITEEVFTNAIRQTISVEDLYYTVIYPTDSRMNLYIPGLLGGFFHTKDTLTDYHLTSTNNSSG